VTACAVAVSALPVYPQTVLEYGISAAGGSSMGVAGKGVSDGINSIFRNLDQQTEKAAAPGRELQRGRPQPEEASGSVTATVRSEGNAPNSASAVTAPSLAAMARNLEDSATPGGAAPQSVFRAPTSEDLEAVEAGEARDEIVARLGMPSARVIIPDAGHLEEIYLYSSRQAHLGKVTLVDGAVSAVNVE